MKRKWFCFLLMVLVFVTSSITAFATVDSSFDLCWLERGESEEGLVTFSGEEDIASYYDGSNVKTEWVNPTDSQSMLRVTATEDAELGNYSVILRGLSSDAVKFINVFVVDKTAPSIFDLDKSKSGITVSWNGTDVGRYQLQYKAIGGKWKTATPFTSKTSYKVTNLSKGTKYFFRVRAVNYNNEWAEIYGDWSKTRAKKF